MQDESRPTAIIIDTNIFLHHDDLAAQSWDWYDLCNSHNVVALIVRQAISEVTGAKDDIRKPDIVQRRAKKAISRIKEWRKNPVQHRRRGQDTFSIRVDTSLPSDNCYSKERNTRVPDDEFIASARYHELSGEFANVYILTGDEGIILQGEAETCGIKVIEAPLQQRLPDVKSRAEREVERLRAEILEEKGRRPKLVLVFDNDEAHTVVEMSYVPLKSDEERKAILDAVRSRIYPAQSPRRPAEEALIPEETKRKITELAEYVRNQPAFGITGNHKAEYLRDYERYIEVLSSYQERMSRSFRLRLFMRNTGNALGTHIDARISFPDIVGIGEWDEEDSPPSEPKLIQYLNRDVLGFGFSGYLGLSPRPIPSSAPLPRNVEFPDISEGEVGVRVGHVRHGDEYKIADLCITFVNPDLVRGFEIQYSIGSKETPDRYIGTLNIRIDQRQESVV